MKLYLFIYLFCIKYCNGLFDPVSIGVAVGIGALYSTSSYTYCLVKECCNDNYIPGDIQKLKNDLQENLFGQHIVIEQLIPALRAHFSSNTASKKPLVISLHGTPGTGKNYVADFIAKRLYKYGLESQYVHKFLGRSDFPLDSSADLYRERINKEVRESVQKCARSLFIFDEVDKMPDGLFEAITSFLDHHSNYNGIDFTKAIFIFLSNTAGVELSSQLASLMKSGKTREETKLSDYEKILKLGAYNLDGGLKKASLIEAHLIDHFIPFLPLEKKHVVKCLQAEFLRWDWHVNENDKNIQKIINENINFDRQTNLFSTSGCKTLEKKVAVVVKFQ